jgi:hypothetical protein
VASKVASDLLVESPSKGCAHIVLLMGSSNARPMKNRAPSRADHLIAPGTITSTFAHTSAVAIWRDSAIK